MIACQKDVKTIPELPDYAKKGVRFLTGVRFYNRIPHKTVLYYHL